MANTLDGNFREKVLPKFLKHLESNMISVKSVDRQTVGDGEWDPESGETVAVKRPTQYNEIETTDGDLTGKDESDIKVGNAFATVQNYITVWIKWTNFERALKLNQLDKLLEPAARRIATTVERNLNTLMINNGAHSLGLVGTKVSAWSEVSRVGDFAKEFGFPEDGNIMVQMNNFDKSSLADKQTGLLNNDLTRTSWEQAQLTDNIAGVRHFTSNALVAHTNGLHAGTLTLGATPTATYDSVKNSYIQSMVISGLTATTGTITAGTRIQVTDNSRTYLQQDTKQPLLGENGLPVKWTGVVTADVTADGSGDATVLVSGPAIFEAVTGGAGAFNTVTSALTSGDAVTLISGAASATNKPNLFYHKQAFGLSFVNLPRLTGGVVSSSASLGDGLVSARVSMYADGTTNKQRVRLDVLPAHAVFNPLLAGVWYGGTTPGQ